MNLNEASKKIDEINKNLSNDDFKFSVYLQERDSWCADELKAMLRTPFGDFKHFQINQISWHTTHLLIGIINSAYRKGLAEGKEKVISNICKAIGAL